MYDLTIELDNDSEKCLYEQIYEHIKQEIREGKLLQEERVPSTRFLAEYLQVSRSTVDMAYGQLLSEGYIEARPYKGYFVCQIEELLDLKKELLSNKETFRKKEQPEEKKIICDFSPFGVDMSLFPFGVWKKITKNILSDSNAKLFSQGNAQGDYSLRETIARYLHASRGVNCTPEQIIIGAGNDYLLMLLEKILGREIPIAMENPTYKRAYRIFESFGYPTKTVDVDENGMVVSQLRRTGVDLAYVMPSHQYPTGAVMPIGRRNELLKWANEKDNRFLIEDDYDSEFRYKGKPIPSLQSSDKNGKVIYLGTFSKAIAPAIRVGYMVLPPVLLERYRKKCSFYSTTVSRIDQKILEEFIKGGYFERHLNKMRKRYRDKHDYLLELLKPFQKQFKITGENAGLHLLLTGTQGKTEQELIETAREQGVIVYGLSENLVEGVQQSMAPTVILGYGGLEEEQLQAGIEALKKAWL